MFDLGKESKSSPNPDIEAIYIIDKTVNNLDYDHHKNSNIFCTDEISYKHIHTYKHLKCFYYSLKNEEIEILISKFLNWIYKIPREKIYRDKSLLELFEYSGKPLWWLTKISQKKKNKTNIFNYFENYYRFKKLFKEKKFKTAIYLGNDKNFVNVYKKFFKINNVTLLSNDINEKRKLTRYYRLGGQIFRAIKLYTKLLLKKKEKTNFINPDVLLLADINDTVDGDDIYFPKFQENLQRRKLFTNIFYFKKNSIDPDLAENNYFYPTFNINIRFLIKLFAKNIYWIYIFKQISHKKNCFEHMDLTKIINDDLSDLIYGKGIKDMLDIEIFENILSKIKPKTVLYRKEFNSFGRKITMSDPTNNIIKLAAQHGIVNEHQLGYRHFNNEVSTKISNQTDFKKYTPTPDILLTFGQRLRDHMITHAYPKEKIIAIGSLRHDIFLKNVDKLSSCFIPNSMLVIAQWPQVLASWLEIIKNSYQTINQKHKIYLRLHPNMKYDLEEYFNMFKNAEFYICDRDERLEKSLSRTEYVFTHSSTVGLEAILLDKKVVVLEQDGLESDNMLFNNDILFDRISNKFDLADVIRKGGKKSNIPSYQNERKKYLKYHLNNIQGNAYEMLSTIIENNK